MTGLGTKYLSHSLDPSCHWKLRIPHQTPARILRSGAGTRRKESEYYCAVPLPATQACNQI